MILDLWSEQFSKKDDSWRCSTSGYKSKHSTAAIGAETLFYIDLDGAVCQTGALCLIYIYTKERAERSSKVGNIGLPQLARVYTIQYQVLHRAGPCHILSLAVLARFAIKILLDRILQHSQPVGCSEPRDCRAKKFGMVGDRFQLWL